MIGSAAVLERLVVLRTTLHNLRNDPPADFTAETIGEPSQKEFKQ